MSVAWFDGVTLTVEVAFTTTPLGAPTWTDVSDYVRGIDINRGRSDEFSTFGPGTLSVTFSNADRRFDPEHGASPYAPNLLPMKRIRVRATYASTTHDLFVGFVQGWPQAYVWTFDSTVTVEAVDASRFLESSDLNRSAYETAVLADGPSHYWPLQEQNTTSSARYPDTVTGREMAPYGGPLPVPVSASPVIGADVGMSASFNPDAINDLSLGIPSVDAAPLSLEAWVYFGAPLSRLVVAAYGPLGDALGFSVDSSGQLVTAASNTALNVVRTSAFTGRAAEPGKWQHVALTLDATELRLYVDGQLAHTSSLSVGTGFIGLLPKLSSYSADASDAVAHIAAYPTTLTAAQVQTHHLAGLTAFGHPYGERSGARVDRVLDEIGWPAGDRALSTGDTVHGAYRPDRSSAMRYLRFVETAEDGLLFIGRDGKVTLRDRTWQWLNTSSATYSDDGSDIPYDDIEIDANSVEPLRNVVSNTYGPNNAYLKVSNDTSVTNYGPAQETLSTPTLESAQTARALAEYRLQRSSTPTSRITRMSVNPRGKPATAYPAVLALELGDRITVERTPQGVGSQIVKSLAVQGYSHRITREGEWMTSFYMSPAPDLATDVPYFIVGDATYGRLGVTAGNQIPF